MISDRPNRPGSLFDLPNLERTASLQSTKRENHIKEQKYKQIQNFICKKGTQDPDWARTFLLLILLSRTNEKGLKSYFEIIETVKNSIHKGTFFNKLHKKSTSFGQLVTPSSNLGAGILWIDHALSLISFVDAIQRWAEQKSQENFNVEITFLIPLTSLLLFSTLLFTCSSLSLTIMTIITLVHALTLLQISKSIYETGIKESPDIAELKKCFINKVNENQIIKDLVGHNGVRDIIAANIKKLDADIPYEDMIHDIDGFTNPFTFLEKLDESNQKLKDILSATSSSGRPSPVRGLPSPSANQRKRARYNDYNSVANQEATLPETPHRMTPLSEILETINQTDPVDKETKADKEDKDTISSTLTSNDSSDSLSSSESIFSSDKKSAFKRPPKLTSRSPKLTPSG